MRIHLNHPAHASWIPVNSVEDFCLWAPPEPGPNSGIGNVEVGALWNSFMERITLLPSYLIRTANRSLLVHQGQSVLAPPSPSRSRSFTPQDGYGTRLIPANTVKGAHFVHTPDYVQVTGFGDFTSMNIPAGDAGGELDPHGATGNGNSIPLRVVFLLNRACR